MVWLGPGEPGHLLRAFLAQLSEPFVGYVASHRELDSDVRDALMTCAASMLSFLFRHATPSAGPSPLVSRLEYILHGGRPDDEAQVGTIAL